MQPNNANPAPRLYMQTSAYPDSHSRRSGKAVSRTPGEKPTIAEPALQVAHHAPSPSRLIDADAQIVLVLLMRAPHARRVVLELRELGPLVRDRHRELAHADVGHLLLLLELAQGRVLGLDLCLERGDAATQLGRRVPVVREVAAQLVHLGLQAALRALQTLVLLAHDAQLVLERALALNRVVPVVHGDAGAVLRTSRSRVAGAVVVVMVVGEGLGALETGGRGDFDVVVLRHGGGTIERPFYRRAGWDRATTIRGDDEF